MKSLRVVVPIRGGRWHKVRAQLEAIDRTATPGALSIEYVYDGSTGETVVFGPWPLGIRCGLSFSPAPWSTGFVRPLNYGAMRAVDDGVDAVLFLGDDHLPRTLGWDVILLDELQKHPLVYGDDLLKGRALSSHVAMRPDVIRTLGWMAPPTFEHLYADNCWMDLGAHYLGDNEVIFEHMHPLAGKADWDWQYEDANREERRIRDLAEYERWKREDLSALRERVSRL